MNKRQENASVLGTDVLTDIAHGYAKRIHSEEKHKRLVAPIGSELPAICYFFTDRGDVVELNGNPFAESALLPDDPYILAMNVFTIALDARVALPVMDVWTGSHCASCRAENDAAFCKDRCGACGAPVVAPRDNPYRTEALMTKIMVKRQPEAWVWLSQIERDEDGAIIGFVDEIVAALVPTMDGRLSRLWELPVEHAEPIARCVPAVQRKLALPLTDWARDLSSAVEALPPSAVEVLSIDPVRWAEHVRVYSVGSLA